MKKFLPQEALKTIACLTMLIDHTAAVFCPGSRRCPCELLAALPFPSIVF